jgi:hypothetical protein
MQCTKKEQWLVSAGCIRSVRGMGMGPGTWSRRRCRWCCSNRRRWEWVGLIGSEEMLQLRCTSRGRCSNRGHRILMVMSRCSWRRWCIRMVFRFLRLSYSNWVWRSLYNFEVVILARCCTPTNWYMKFTDLAQFCHGLCKKFCWDPISKALKQSQDKLN